MKDGSVLGTATAIAKVPFRRVRTLLTPAGARILLDLTEAIPEVSVGVEPVDALVWIHGNYWYQGEYRFEEHPDGTKVTYQIRNISGHPDLAIRLWQWRTLRDQPKHLAEYADSLAERLQKSTEP